MKQLVYITGSGHSGSTLLDRLLGSHPDVMALGEIHRFSLGLHRDEKPFRCDCGLPLQKCPFWERVIEKILKRMSFDKKEFLTQFKTSDHSVLGQISGEKYFNAKTEYQFLPRDLEKYFLTLMPSLVCPLLDRLGLLGNHLSQARNSHVMFDAVSELTEKSTIVDSTKSPMRMRALHLTAYYPMKVIYLKRDGRAVTNSRMKRQSISMERAAKIWVAENKKVRMVLRSMKGVDILEVNYEDLCGSPKGEIARIYRFLKLPDSPASLSTTERHAVGGNPSRFNIDDVIVADEKWRQDLSLNDLAIFDKYANSEQQR